MNTENKLIAEFMGFELQNNPNERWFNQWFTKETLNKPYNSRIEILHFDTDWNWLMEVVEKVESLGVIVEIRENVCYISPFPNNYICELKDTKLQATYKAVVEFIKWYNKQK